MIDKLIEIALLLLAIASPVPELAPKVVYVLEVDVRQALDEPTPEDVAAAFKGEFGERKGVSVQTAALNQGALKCLPDVACDIVILSQKVMTNNTRVIELRLTVSSYYRPKGMDGHRKDGYLKRCEKYEETPEDDWIHCRSVFLRPLAQALGGHVIAWDSIK